MNFELSSNFKQLCINLEGCVKTCKYFILTIKENCQIENYGKFGKKLVAFIELCSFFFDILAFELGKLCPGVGILFCFFDPGAGVLH